MNRLLAVLTIWVAVIVPGAAQAGKSTETLFQEGNKALQTGRFHEARDLLKKAHLSAQGVGTAFNLAVALRGTGEVVECHQLFAQLLQGKFGPVRPKVRKQAQMVSGECLQTIAHLEVTADQAGMLWVNGVQRGPLVGARPSSLELNPGTHLITIRDQGLLLSETRVELGRGERKEVNLSLSLPKATLLVRSEAQEGWVQIVGQGKAQGQLKRVLPPGEYTAQLLVDEQVQVEKKLVLKPAQQQELLLSSSPDSVFEQAWFWWAAAGVAVVAGGVVAGIALSGPTIDDPVPSSWTEPQVIP